MQIIRLLQTTLILLQRKQTTAKELAEHFEVSPRTIYRDIDALSLAGIPVYSVKGHNGGIFLDEQFSVDNTLIPKEEQQELFLALKLLQTLGLVDSQQLLSKLGQVYDWSNWLELELSNTFELDATSFKTLKQAIFQKMLVCFTYYTSYGQTRKITLLPQKILYRGRTWYVIGYDELQEQWLPYELARIKKVLSLQKNTAVPTPPATVTVDQLAVTLRFSKRIAYKKYDEFAKLAISTNPDSSFDITFTFSELNELYSFLLPLGKNVEILEPLWVRAKVLAHVQAFWENHL